MTLLLDVPEFLAVGHVTHDHAEGGAVRPGGAALYSAVTARRLGKRSAILTSFGEDFLGWEALHGIDVKRVGAARTSRFRNIYEGSGRIQYVYEQAGRLGSGDLPPQWAKAGIVYLCPVVHEISECLGESFPDSVIGVAPQGWMRAWDETGRIRGRRWEGFESLLARATMVIVSEEDTAGEPALVEAFRKLTPIVIVTCAGQGARVFARGGVLTVGSYPAVERDPTGAGDCFGAAFLVRLVESGDVEQAGRFAACVGACVVEHEGVSGIPCREVVESRMRRQAVRCEWQTG
jgi:sugar/nucleoside kinase (ribokinase family)